MNTNIIPPAPASDFNLYVSASASAWVWIAVALVVVGIIGAIVMWADSRKS